MVIVEGDLAMLNWQTVEIAYMLTALSKNMLLRPLSFEALKQCLILFKVYPQIFVLWELRQDSPYNNDRCVLFVNSMQLISLIWGENWHILKPSNIDPTDSAYPVEVL